MAIAAWAATTSFSVGNVRRSSSDEGTGLFFRCTTAGTSASSEPEWPKFQQRMAILRSPTPAQLLSCFS